MSEDEKKDDAAFYKSKHYFSLDDATSDISMADGVKDTTAAVAKLAGKALFNVGLLAGKTSFFAAKEMIRNAPSIAASIAEQNLSKTGHKMTDEQRVKTEDFVEKNKGKKSF